MNNNTKEKSLSLGPEHTLIFMIGLVSLLLCDENVIVYPSIFHPDHSSRWVYLYCGENDEHES